MDKREEKRLQMAEERKRLNELMKEFDLTSLKKEDASGNSNPNTSFMILVDNGFENDAIEYYKTMKDKLDINIANVGDCELARRFKIINGPYSPIHHVLCLKMFKLADLLMQDERFDVNTQDGFGETFAESALLSYGLACSDSDDVAKEYYKNLFYNRTFKQKYSAY